MKEKPNLDIFINEFEDKVSEPQQLLVLEEALKATSERWWDTHKTSIGDWHICLRIMEIQFGEAEYYQGKKYDGRNDPTSHLVA